MKILLDIDGVMVPISSWKPTRLLQDGFPEFHSRAIQGLKSLISKTNGDIVLTTSHKYKYTLEQWIDIFKFRGINISSIERLPYNSDNLSRKEEILNWFDLNNEESFIIVDDDKSLNGLPNQLKDRLILVSPMIGLTESLIDRFLNNG